MEGMMTFVQPFFDWLLETTLIGSVVICLILAAQKMLGGKLGPRWCHALWLILLIRMVLPWAPSSRISLFNLIPSWDRQVQREQLTEAVEQHEPSQAAQTSDATKAVPVGRPGTDASIQKETSEPETLTNMQNEFQSRLVSLRRILPILWLAGAIVIGGYLLISDLALWRIVKRDSPLVNQPMLELFEECKAWMNVQSLVVVVPSDQVRSPGLFGFVRPRLLLPREMLDTATQQEMRYVFLHELAHLRRHDIYLGWLTSLLQVLHWFNPLVWFAFYRMRTDRELACDALVLTRTGQEKSHEYGGAILGLVRRFSRSRRLPAMAGILETKSQLKRRIAMITQFENNSYRWSVTGIGIIAVLGAISMTDATRGTASTGSVPQAKPAVTMRLVEERAMPYWSISPDGRYLCGYTRGWAGREIGIRIRELATGEERIIKPTKETPTERDPLFPVMSPDNKTIAYIVQRPEETVDGLIPVDLRLIAADGSGQRVLYRSVVSGPPAIKPIQWFPDGSRLLALQLPDPIHARTEVEIVSVLVADGSVQVIKKLTAGFFNDGIRLAPDGKYVAYELLSKVAPEKHDIVAIEIDSGQETTLVGHAANDNLLDWTPDGRHILFVSDRLGPPSVWLLPVAQGRAQGTPKLVAHSTGPMRPMGFAQNGSYYYRTGATSTADIYTAVINIATGQLVSPPAPLEGGGYNRVADWSPDGKYLAYCSRPPTAKSSDPGVIRIRTLATGEEREVANKLTTFDCLRWSPDGRSLLASWLLAYKPEDIAFPKRVYRIDAATGEATVLLDKKDTKQVIMIAELSQDGKTLYYWQAGFFRRELDTGQEKIIFSRLNEGPWSGWALSPNGEFIATGFNEGTGKNGPRGEPEGGVKKLLLIPSQGGEPTELVRWDREPASYLSNTCWSPDGKTVLFTLHRPPVAGTNAKPINEFWQVSKDGGEPRKIMETDLRMPRAYGIRVHPDGERIAFSAAVARGVELWAMENFLPEAKAMNK